jgi:hypothetical protein
MEPTPSVHVSGELAGHPVSKNLDDLFAEMTGGAPAESEQQVQGRVQALFEAIKSEANTDRGAVVPRVPVPQPVVAPDGDLFDAFGAATAEAGRLIGDNIDGAIVLHIIKRGMAALGGATLAESVRKINNLYQRVRDDGQTVDVGALYASIVDDMDRDGPALNSLRLLVHDEELDIPLPQASAVMCFVDAYPLFWPNLTRRTKELRFNSRTADGRGGGLFEDDMIHMSRLPSTPPGVFVRLLVHEMGHATFEKTLLADAPMPHELEANQQVPGMLVRFGTGMWIEKDQLSKLSQRCQEIQAYWNRMSDWAKTFYCAWLTLREHDGKHLLGLDMWQDPNGNRLSAEQRQRYQAGKFDEFCAEVFMQFAMGDLYRHVLAALDDDAIGAGVKTAWRNVWHVLDAVASPILGQRQGV